jgi:PAS domain S-box-containing protein
MAGDRPDPASPIDSRHVATTSLGDVLSIDELARQPVRAPDFEAENRAIAKLVHVLAETPETILQELVDTALEQCRADSAGISILEDNTFFRWYAVAGRWSAFANGGMPRSASPCGTVIDRDAPLMFSHPGRYFPEMAKLDPLAVSALLVPFHLHGKPFGTVWVVTHTHERKFDLEDHRVLTSLSRFASAAYQAHLRQGLERKIEEHTEELSATHKARASLVAERERLIHDLEVHQAELEVQNRQLRETQLLLEESRGRYSDLYDFAPIAYCTLDLSGCILELNLAGAALLETPRGQLIGKPLALFVSSGDRPAFRSYWAARKSSTEEQTVFELTLRPSSKPSTTIQMINTPARDHDSGVVGYRTVLTDITELKRAEEALRLAVRMREDFLAVVSHDLRTPLNSIVLGSEVLLHAPGLETGIVEHLHRITRAATRMSLMLGDLLDLSSMDAGHLSMEREIASIDQLLTNLVESLESNAAERSVRLHLKLDAPGLVVYCDRDRIGQVLTNLISNAIKFSRRGDRIRIEARHHIDGVEIAVRDSGVGIDASQLEHIFDPYWQAASSAKKGTGLGLAIAKGIVEAHGGKIWAESDAGRGSSFFFTLPSARAQGQHPDLRRRAAASSGPLSLARLKETGGSTTAPRRSILIIDDEIDSRDLLARLLQDEGHAIATASNGAEGLEYLRTADALPSLILLDLVMPIMDGWEFLEARGRDARLHTIPVMLISGQLTSRDTARTLGLANYIEKPIVAATLLQLIDSMN